MFQLARVSEQPILLPRSENEWEKDAVFNCAAVYRDGVFHLFYRAVAHPNFSVIGHASSRDGVHFERRPEPAIRREFPEEAIGVEDPRITLLEEDGLYHMLFTTWDEREIQVGEAVSPDLERWERRGLIVPFDLMGHNKDAALFPKRIGGRFALIHRPEPDMVLSFSDDLRHWSDHRVVMRPRPDSWEELKIGAGAQPIYTPAGWLMVYHGVDRDRVYRLGLALLDLHDPAIVLKRQEAPILEPELEWERRGDVPNVVFTCGALLFDSDLWVYYGGADTVIGLARGDVREFLEL